MSTAVDGSPRLEDKFPARDSSLKPSIKVNAVETHELEQERRHTTALTVESEPPILAPRFPARISSLSPTEASQRRATDTDDRKTGAKGEAPTGGSPSTLAETGQTKTTTDAEDPEPGAAVADQLTESSGNREAMPAEAADAARRSAEAAVSKRSHTELSESPRPGTPVDDSPAASSDSPATPDATARMARNSMSLSKFRRRSWMPSRSPSPQKQEPAEAPAEIPTSNPTKPPTGFKERFSTVILNTSKSNRQSTFSLTSKLKKRQSSALALDALGKASNHEAPLPGSKIPKSLSADKLSTPSLISSLSTDRLSTYIQTDVISFHISAKSRGARKRKRDELWTPFRDLEAACTKFQSKVGDQKCGVLRTSLSQFLQEHPNHPSDFRLHSDFNLHPDDLDRRVMVLYKWWMALLEFVKSRMFTTVTNQSRTMVLDTIMGIMDRPEWRHVRKSPFCPASGKSSDANSESNSSNSDDFAVESVQHNIRNYFSQCLLLQLAFVIDRMSIKAVPSLVSFCGKTCAYAFFFCPGIAAILVSLWSPKLEAMKRVLEQNGLSTSANLSEAAERVSSAMPYNLLKEVQFSTIPGALRDLRKPVNYPVGAQSLPWKGPWLDKWTGMDSDLFYSFVKQYYVILYDYIPEVPKGEYLTVAGGIYVQAQILANIDATIRRSSPKSLDQPPQGALKRSPLSKDGLRSAEDIRRATSVTFDDVIGDPDSSALPISLINSIGQGNALLSNAERNLAENRLIVLLRDMLATKNNEVPKPIRESFAYTFVSLLQASAKATPQFNRYAAETLCDFLEETVVILVRYEQITGLTTPILDWSFWFGVWKLMAQSNNYFTEMKVYSLIYTLWPAIIVDPERKAELCYDFLLDEHHFDTRFNHWSPMVRAYFMRLLCWRVARSHEDSSAHDMRILQRLLERLKGVFHQFLSLRESAAANGQRPPNTSPSNAAPNRRFIIIRGDQGPSRHGPLLGFDTPVAPHNAAYKRSLMLEQLCSPDVDLGQQRPQSSMSAASTLSDSDRDILLEDSPKRWTRGGLLRTIIGGGAASRSKSSSPGPRGAASAPERPPTSSPEVKKRLTGLGDGAAAPTTINDGGVDGVPSPPRPDFRSFYFRFSLELVDRRGPPAAALALQMPRLPQPAHLLLMRHLRGSAVPVGGAGARRSDDDGAPPPLRAESSEDEAEHAAGAAGRAPRAPSPDTSEALLPAAAAIPPDRAAYCGRALAEWTVLVSECHMFFERRKAEGVPGNRWVETPLLGADGFLRIRG